jgi:type IV pilus assembly protein PilM
MHLFRKINWVALVQDNNWIVAKVSCRKKVVRIHKLFEHTSEGESSENYQSQGTEGPGTNNHSGNVGEPLKLRLKKERIPLKKLKVAISCSGVITRIITLPLLTAKELETLLTEQVDQYFTLNVEDYFIDYCIVDQFEEDGQKRQRILLAAIPKFQWEKLRKEWNEIGFAPKVVDLAAASLSRLYGSVGQSSKASPESPSSDYAIVDLSRNRIEIILLEHGVFFLYSDLEVKLKGLEDYANSLKDVQSQVKVSESKEESDAQDNELKLSTVEMTELWAQSEMEEILNPVLVALSDFLSFFSSRHYGKSVDEIFLTGHYSNIPLLTVIFKQVLGIETQVGFPNGWHPQFKEKSKELQENWMKYGSLYGLALRED